MEQERNKRLRNQIIMVASFALVIILVAALFIGQHIKQSKEEEKLSQMINEEMSKQLDENSQKAEELRKKINKDLVGNYLTMGDVVTGEGKNSYMSISLMGDGTATAVKAADGTSVDGWWVSSKKGDVELVSMGFDGGTSIEMYQVYNSYLIDTASVYFGHVQNLPAFQSVFTMENEKGKMVIEINDDGKASGEFIDTNEDSENYGLKYMFGGNYTVDGEFMNITLNSATTKFIMFDYNLTEGDTDSGIASIFYRKQI